MGKDMFSMDISGLDAVVAKLEALEGGVDDAVATALETASLEVESVAKSMAPVETGTLRRSITHEVSGGDARVGPSEEVPYAARIEFGFTGADALGRNFSTSAQPYLRPALMNTRSAQRAAFVGAISDLAGS
ncbi:HK97-gp10 family putative phage morphogenesis protein [Alkalicoccus chagannorensis]|uniref:HK97-gp10 family putative phage morphogenesis protein n=1 Tax=Alkalicoccus chagannorensis TaxID=427072 RepID=UPI00047B11F6|nr:HK97-gp10 family putative phage morphogenesis protein [Alkalicoccus chagannorensis]